MRAFVRRGVQVLLLHRVAVYLHFFVSLFASLFVCLFALSSSVSLYCLCLCLCLCFCLFLFVFVWFPILPFLSVSFRHVLSVVWCCGCCLLLLFAAAAAAAAAAMGLPLLARDCLSGLIAYAAALLTANVNNTNTHRRPPIGGPIEPRIGPYRAS